MITPDDSTKTVKEAVARLLEMLSKEYADDLAAKEKADLVEYHFTLGEQIRNLFGLWGPNETLIEAMGGQSKHADEMSMVIIDALWDELQKRRTRH